MESYSNGIDCSGCSNALITGNNIMNNGNGTTTAGEDYGILFRNTVSNVKILSNMIGDNQSSKTQEGIYLNSSTGNIYASNNDLSTVKTATNAFNNASNGYANTFRNNVPFSTILTAASTAVTVKQLMYEYIRLDCDNASDCAFTLIEPTGLTDGQMLTIECDNPDAQGYTCTIADQLAPDILDVAGTFIMTDGDTITMRWSSNAGMWLETARSDK